MNNKVLLVGGSGLIGQSIQSTLQKAGFEVYILSRTKQPGSENWLVWNPKNHHIDSKALTLPYVINLAGAGIADQRWTSNRKKILHDSRVESTRFLFDAYKKAGKFPEKYLGASAIGYYGDRKEAMLAETADPGKNFLANLCINWEEAHQLFSQHSSQFQIFRIGIVLTTKGSVLEKSLGPLKAGMAGYFGSGSQIMSWIHIGDLCNMMSYALRKDLESGIYNAVAPHPVSNRNFIKKVRNVMNPVSILIPVPKLALKLMLGEMAEIVFDSTHVSANKIKKPGFEFQFPQLESALKDIKKRDI